MLVRKKAGVCVKHMRKSVTARLMTKMLEGVRRFRLLHTHAHTHTRDSVSSDDEDESPSTFFGL